MFKPHQEETAGANGNILDHAQKEGGISGETPHFSDHIKMPYF